MSLSVRRWAAIAGLCAPFAAFVVVIASSEPRSMRLFMGIAAIMVLGTLSFGFSLLLLRCPECGASLARDAAGRWDAEEKSFVGSLVVLLRPLSCPRCGARE